MATTLTLKGIPDDLYGRLKRSAQIHRRSLNSEALSVLESVLLPRQESVVDRLAQARVLREGLPRGAFSAGAIAAAKQRGRR